MLLSAVLTVLQCAGFGSVTFLRTGLVGTTIAGAICGGATVSWRLRKKSLSARALCRSAGGCCAWSRA